MNDKLYLLIYATSLALTVVLAITSLAYCARALGPRDSRMEVTQ